MEAVNSTGFWAKYDKLAADVKSFLKGTEDYEGCDWCCGGGDDWADELEARAEGLHMDLGDIVKAVQGRAA